MEKEEQQSGLKRSLNLLDATAISVGAIIGGGISSYNKEQGGEDNAQTLCLVLRAPDEEVVGGVIGAVFWDWGHSTFIYNYCSPGHASNKRDPLPAGCLESVHHLHKEL